MRARPADNVKLFSGIIAPDKNSLDETITALTEMFGAIDIKSEIIPFDFTEYYADEMGKNLLRQFVAFEKLISPDEIADIKLKTNALEEQMGSAENGALKRRVNIDPGYIAPSKVVLATAKDFSHRVYLGQGIYGEVTFGFKKKGGLAFFDWTFPDFRSGKYDDFFIKTRERLMKGGKESLAERAEDAER